MRVLIIGATGATGRALVNNLLQDERIDEVVAFVRKKSFAFHSKLTETEVDFEYLENYFEYIEGDVAISCFGTTRREARNKRTQWHIDHDIPLKFAQIAYRNGVSYFLLVSAANANVNSPFFYSRLKAVLEEGVRKIGFPNLFVFQPSILIRPNSNRPFEKMAVHVLSFFNKLGLYRKHQPLPVATLAEAMKAALFEESARFHVFSLDEIKRLAKN